jgi:RNA polymerase sigma factor (sigma-70 family)
MLAVSSFLLSLLTAAMSESTRQAGPSPRVFATTHWGVVLTARDANAPGAAVALATLCRTYWQPICAYIRREGFREPDAQDLTQEFFARLLEKNYLGHLQHQRGKFRSFLLTFLKHFLSDERDKARAQKRGSGKAVISLDDPALGEGWHMASGRELSAEQLFDRRWAQTVLDNALRQLGEEYRGSAKGALFERLKDYQPGAASETYAQIGAELGMSEDAVKSAVQRLRRRHREILRANIAHTVDRPEEINEEIRYLIEVIGSSQGFAGYFGGEIPLY